MTHQQTGDGFTAHQWYTIKGPDVYHFLSDGACLQLIADDHDTPSFWRADYVDADGVVSVAREETFPLRSGGLEWCRGWIEKAGLKTVPTDEQKASAWYQYRKGGEFDRDRARQISTPAGRDKSKTLAQADAEANVLADVAKAVEMAQAIDMAMKIDAAMRAAPAPVLPAILSPTIDDAVDCPTCNGFGFVGHPDDPAGKCPTCEGAGAIKLSELMASIDRQMKPVLPSYTCPHCKSTFGTTSCPECGGVAQQVV